MIKFVLRAAREEPLMGLTEPVFVGFCSIFYVFKHFPTICPGLWIGKATSCSKTSQTLIQKTRSADLKLLISWRK